MLGQAKSGWIGVDIGERAIKVAQLRRDGDRLVLASTAVYRRHADSLSLSDDLLAAKTLSEGLRGARAAATLTMRDSLVEPVNEGRPETRAEGRCVDGWEAGPVSAYTLSVPAERVEATVDGLSRVGLHCCLIDGPPLAIARVLRLTPGYRSDELIGALDWGETAVTFVAASGGQARYVRRLAGGGLAAVRDRVAEELGLGEADAEQAILRYGARAADPPTPEARVVNEVARAAVRPTIQDLKRSLEHLGGKLKCKGPERIVMLGAGAAAPGLAGIVSAATDRPAEEWRAAGVSRRSGEAPDCLLAQAIALSALAWEANAGR